MEHRSPAVQDSIIFAEEKHWKQPLSIVRFSLSDMPIPPLIDDDDDGSVMSLLAIPITKHSGIVMALGGAATIRSIIASCSVPRLARHSRSSDEGSI